MPSDYVLVHAAGSGVGTAAVQLASHTGARVIAVAGDDKKLDTVASLGAWQGINYKTQPSWGEDVRSLTGGPGATLILDPIGASNWKQNAEALAVGGTWVLYGSLGGLNIEGPLFASLIHKCATLRGTTLRDRSDAYKADLVARFTAEALPLLASGQWQYKFMRICMHICTYI